MDVLCWHSNEKEDVSFDGIRLIYTLAFMASPWICMATSPLCGLGVLKGVFWARVTLIMNGVAGCKLFRPFLLDHVL